MAPGPGGGPLGGPGLHEPGRRALRWPLRKAGHGAVCGHGVQQVGHDIGHGGGGGPSGPGPGPGEPLRGPLLPHPADAGAPAGGECAGVGGGAPHPDGAPVPPHGLCAEI